MVGTEERTDYEKYRGKCKEMSEAYCKDHPEFHLTRGYFHEPFWGTQQHWWCQNDNGDIYDPSVKQFPIAACWDGYTSKNMKRYALYEEYNGIIVCSYCGKQFHEDDECACGSGSHCYCSSYCYMKDVM